MEAILTDFSAPALARAVKTNLYDFFRYLRHSPQTVYSEENGLARWHSPVPYPWYNGILAARPAANGDDEMIRQTIAWFWARSVAHFTWWIKHPPHAPGWEKLLIANGLHPTGGPPGMAVDLQTLDENHSAPVGLRIVPVINEDLLKVWTSVFISGYELPLDWEAPFFDLMLGIGMDLPVRNYLGYLDDDPVATSSLFLSAGVAGVQFVSTCPHARGRGLGAVLTLAPLLDARRMAYRIGVLQSSDMGFSIYRRLGFQQVCQVEHYYWAGEGDVQS